MVGSSSRTLAATMTPVAITVVSYITYVGFVIPKGYEHPWFSWIRYVNPIAYTFEALMINEVRRV
jgi:ATP-binding cassette subfamily G (WHITE) protein 2 (PDR)